MGDGKRRLPLWVANVIVFTVLFCTVSAYFLWQVRRARRDFLAHVREHAVLVAEVIQLNARGSVLSRQAAEEILEAFLGNTARFVEHLEMVEPFTAEELTAFSREAGLAGIAIEQKGGNYVEGPAGWLTDHPPVCEPAARLHYLAKEHLYLFSLIHSSGKGCVIVGISDARIRTIQEHLGLENVIHTLSGIPQISYVKLVESPGGAEDAADNPLVSMQEKDGRRVAEARVPMDGKEIAMALDTRYLDLAIERLWRDFFVFSAGLASLGILLSLILYRYQAAHLAQVQQFERSIAADRENAVLGRSAAAIAHEVRNPLNVIGMGLQRLRIEGQSLDGEHRHLIDLMLGAMKRANTSVEGLLKYARPQRPLKKPMRLDLLTEDILELYGPRCRELGIAASSRIRFQEPVPGDRELLGQVVQNLFKNAMEAQPEGGSIHLEIEKKEHGVRLRMTNPGFSMPAQEAERILEPYVTTKADGTGLGLSISRRIVEAHGGHMRVQVPEPGTLEITVWLPAADESEPDPNRQKKQGEVSE